MKNLIRLLLYIAVTAHCSRLLAQSEHNNEIRDDPWARLEYEFEKTRDPKSGTIPENIARREFDFASKIPNDNPYSKRNSLLATSNWVQAGPRNQSGRVQAVGIDILNERNMLAGTASGGVWRTIDGGQSWVKVTPPNELQTVSAIVQDTRKGKESTWYYSTSELLSTTDRRLTTDIRTHSYGNGIYRSTDNGASWQPLASTQTRNGNTAPANFQGIWNLALDTRNISQDIIYASCFGGIMRSSDGGATWTTILGSLSEKNFNSDLVIGSGGTMYASIGSAYDGTVTSHQGVWRSNNGINWVNISGSLLPNTYSRSRLAVSQVSDSVLYFLSETPADWTIVDQSFEALHSLLRYTYLSGDGRNTGGKWEERVVPYDNDGTAYNKSLAGYALTLTVSPNNYDEVFVGGTNLYYSPTGYISDAKTVKLGGYPLDMKPGSLHPDMHAVVFSHSNHHKLFVGCDGGVEAIEDYLLGDGNWVNFNNGLISSQVYHSSLDHETPDDNLIVSGLQDNNSFLTYTAMDNADWYDISGGDGMTTAIANGQTLMFASYQGGNIVCIENDGTSLVSHGGFPSMIDQFYFFTNFILEPNATEELYLASATSLWRYDFLSSIIGLSGGIFDNWTEITSVKSILSADNSSISAFGFATNVRDRLFFGTRGGKIYKLDNAASLDPNPINISGAQFPSGGFVAGVEVDPQDADHILAIFSNYNIQSIFYTIDGGKTWSPVSGNLEEFPDGSGAGPSVRCGKILHTPKGIVYYVGTSVGLYSTTLLNGLQTVWTKEGTTTIGTIIVDAIDARQNDGRVIVSTQGGGVFINTPSSGVTGKPFTVTHAFQLEQNYPNPFAGSSQIRFTVSTRSDVTIEMYNTLGVKLSTLASGSFDIGSHIIALSSMGLAKGNYFVRATLGNTIITKMITVFP